MILTILVTNFQNFILILKSKLLTIISKVTALLLFRTIFTIFVNKKKNNRKLFQPTKDSARKSIINRLNNKIKNSIAKEKQKSSSNFLSSLSPDDYSLWNIKKNLLVTTPLLSPSLLLILRLMLIKIKQKCLLKRMSISFPLVLILLALKIILMFTTP